MSCVVPAGRFLMLVGPVVDCSTVEPAPYHATTDAGLRRCARARWRRNMGQEKLTLDGVAIQPPAVVGGSAVFSFTMPARNNFLGVVGRTHGRADVYGDAAILRPLSPGVHTLVQDSVFANFEVHALTTYRLTVG
jgi:hypothetical protein